MQDWFSCANISTGGGDIFQLRSALNYLAKKPDFDAVRGLVQKASQIASAPLKSSRVFARCSKEAAADVSCNINVQSEKH
jgi:hypothetical protein